MSVRLLNGDLEERGRGFVGRLGGIINLLSMLWRFRRLKVRDGMEGMLDVFTA